MAGAATGASIALHAVVFPSMDKLEADDASLVSALQSIRTALEKAESANPGVTHELVDAILEAEQAKGGMESDEKLLRVSGQPIGFYEVPPKTQELKDLIKSSAALKGILSGIPDQIEDRTKFLGIIRDIASAIKNLLDAINAVATENAALVKSQKNNLEANKKKFVRGSKTFSDTLKAFFKDGKRKEVFRSAHNLINQTNTVLRTIKVAADA